jgi:hypothetical protein
MSPCTNFLYTVITFSSRIASFVSSAVLEVSSSPTCSSSLGRKAPACVLSRGMLSVGENSVCYQYEHSAIRGEEIRGPRGALYTCSALAQLW